MDFPLCVHCKLFSIGLPLPLVFEKFEKTKKNQIKKSVPIKIICEMSKL